MWSRCCCSELGGAAGMSAQPLPAATQHARVVCHPGHTRAVLSRCAMCPALQRLTVPPPTPPLCCSVVFPMLCFDDEDAELWEDDPQEYIRKVGGFPVWRLCAWLVGCS